MCCCESVKKGNKPTVWSDEKMDNIEIPPANDRVNCKSSKRNRIQKKVTNCLSEEWQ